MTAIATSERMYTKKEAAARLGVSVSTVERRVKDGQLRSVKMGHLVRIAPDDLQEYILGCSTAGRADRRPKKTGRPRARAAANSARDRKTETASNGAVGETPLSVKGRDSAAARPKAHRRRKKGRPTAAQSKQLLEALEALALEFKEASSGRRMPRKR